MEHEYTNAALQKLSGARLFEYSWVFYLWTAMNSNQVQTFVYDDMHRLTRAYTNAVGNGRYDESYAYDANSGNLISKAGITLSYDTSQPYHGVRSTELPDIGLLSDEAQGAGIAGYEVQGTIQSSYGYDANGNMNQRVVGGVTYTLTYDYENRLTAVTGGTTSYNFIYDGDGNRVKSELVTGGVTTSSTYFVGSYFEKTVVGATTTFKKYYFIAGARVAMTEGTAVKFLLSDHIGSITTVLNSSGLSISNKWYYPWGGIRYGSNPATGYGFTGQWEEPSVAGGIDFNNARWFDPQLGRFLSADTITPGIDSLAWDRFAYAKNNPVKYKDPTGFID